MTVVLGDLGQTFNSLSTLQHYEKTGGQTVLFVGDLSYADRYEHNDGIRWDSWGRLVERSTAYQPWIWNSGNHEIEYRPDLVMLFSHLCKYLFLEYYHLTRITSCSI
jgi:acid phosphatase type 7